MYVCEQKKTIIILFLLSVEGNTLPTVYKCVMLLLYVVVVGVLRGRSTIMILATTENKSANKKWWWWWWLVWFPHPPGYRTT